MSGEAWTIVATQLVTTLGIVYLLVQRMDSLGSELRQDLGARIDRVRDDLGARIDVVRDELGARIDRVRDDLGARMDAPTARIDAHIERHPS